MRETTDTPIQAQSPIIPINRWLIVDNCKLVKVYNFSSLENRNFFLFNLFNYEQKVQHQSRFQIEDLDVKLVLQTKDLDGITELDREYAKFADLSYKDIAQSQENLDVVLHDEDL